MPKIPSFFLHSRHRLQSPATGEVPAEIGEDPSAGEVPSMPSIAVGKDIATVGPPPAEVMLIGIEIGTDDGIGTEEETGGRAGPDGIASAGVEGTTGAGAAVAAAAGRLE
jgi:hypothetical protein